MIDFENQIITAVANALEAAFSADFPVYGKTELAPAVFPCACVDETENTVKSSTRTNEKTENFADVTYEIRAYSNLERGGKAQAKEIFSIIDSVFSGYGFSRISKQSVPQTNPNVYCLFGRYTATISESGIIYWR